MGSYEFLENFWEKCEFWVNGEFCGKWRILGKRVARFVKCFFIFDGMKIENWF